MTPRYVYRFDPPHWVVGWLDEEGNFSPHSIHDTTDEAAKRAHELNGSVTVGNEEDQP